MKMKLREFLKDEKYGVWEAHTAGLCVQKGFHGPAFLYPAVAVYRREKGAEPYWWTRFGVYGYDKLPRFCSPEMEGDVFIR